MSWSLCLLYVWGGSRRGCRCWMAAMLPSVCPRAAVATIVVYHHRYDFTWMNGTWNPIRCFGCFEKCQVNPIHYCPSLPWRVSRHPKAQRSEISTLPFHSHLAVQCSGRSPGSRWSSSATGFLNCVWLSTCVQMYLTISITGTSNAHLCEMKILNSSKHAYTYT